MSNRLLFVVPSFAGGGAERVALTYLNNVDRTVFEPELLVFDDSGPLRTLVSPDVPVRSLNTLRLRNSVMQMVAHIRRTRPRVVFSTLGYVNIALLSIRNLFPSGTKVVVREANLPSLSLKASARPWLYETGYRWAYKRANGVLCTSRIMARELVDNFAVPEDRVRIVCNPVDVERIRDLASRPAGLQTTEYRNLISCGRLTHQKGYDRLIPLMAQMPEDIHLTILGDGPERGHLRSLIQSHKLEDRVRIEPFQSEPWRWYGAADAYVMPSRWEGMPNAALEALACGLPVIATLESGGLPELSGGPMTGLTISAFGQRFAGNCASVASRRGKGMGESLLPEGFSLPNACQQFNDVMQGIST